MPGAGLLLRALRRGVLVPAERAGLLPSRYYVAQALAAPERDDLEGTVATLECCRRRDGGPRVALAREQTLFRLRTLLAARRDAAARADARGDYLEGLAREGRREVARQRLRRRAAALGGLAFALAASLAGTGVATRWAGGGALVASLVLAALAVAGVVSAAIAGRAVEPGSEAARLAEATRLDAVAAGERQTAAAEREAAAHLGRLERRLRVPAPAEDDLRGPTGAGPPPTPPAAVLLPATSYRRLP